MVIYVILLIASIFAYKLSEDLASTYGLAVHNATGAATMLLVVRVGLGVSGLVTARWPDSVVPLFVAASFLGLSAGWGSEGRATQVVKWLYLVLGCLALTRLPW